MRYMTGIACLAIVLCMVAFSDGQPPGGKGKKDKKDGPGAGESIDLVTYMMSFNKKNDGKLTKEELTDTRLHRLFDRADTNKDGVVTREELAALVKQLDAENQGGGDFGPGKGGPDKGGPGGPG